MQQPPIIRYNNVKPRKWWEKISRKRVDYSQLLDRSIYSNFPDPEIPNNKISTSKYNFFTFVPLNLIEQFTKLSNIYFLFIGILQTIPVISLSEGKPTIFLPLFIVVFVSMIKDFVQDLKRHNSDKKENESEVEFLSGVGFVTRKWENLRVGDIIKVYKDQYFPCDVILLDHPRDQKTAFVQTKNLDGQTNLKLKKISQHLDFLRGLSELDLSALQIEFAFEKPNPFLSTFNGNVKVREKKYMIENSNLILRGCSLKINEWAIGMCVYTGHQTKILLNSGTKKTKVSSLQHYLNKYFRYIFIFQLSVTLLSSIAFGILEGIYQDRLKYVSQGDNIVANIFYTWGSWFISFSNFIPISLLVTVEIVRYGQGMILNKDELCSSRGQFTEVQTSSINEELGQVKYIMSDKTGTLTQNLMEFKCFFVNGQDYGSTVRQSESKQSDKIVAENLTNRPFIQEGKLNMQQLMNHSEKIANVDFSQKQKERILNSIVNGGYQSKKLHEALLHLSLCHNVITEKNSYTSSSPDELALVSFAKFIGYKFLQKNDNNEMEILQKLPGKEEKVLKYKLLHTLEFSSDRKRMSVILQDMNQEDKRILLLTKGADEIILSRLNNSEYKQGEGKRKLDEVQNCLYNYACQGLRTLLLAQREVSSQEYFKWNNAYNDSLTIIGPERYEKIENLQSQLERNLELVGATAIEDKLQDNVKQTIEELKKSNIKVWMLTGDKRQTAISIGFSCGLIDKHSERITLDCDAENARNLLENLTSMMHLIHSKKVTIFSGEFIKKIDEESRKHLENILAQSQSVICCRVSPKDKQQITKMVRKWGITLAIGDGANDVNMINSANVGVGVRGIEGSQATRAADYVITEFKILRRLVVYHGFNYYHRNANVMLYTLYKNMLVTLPNLLYGPISMESGTYIYEIWVIQFYNIFYVALPIVYYGLFDILYSWKEIKQKPWLYSEGQNSSFFNKKVLVKQLVSTILICTLLLYTVFYSTQQQLSGRGLMIYEEWSGNLILAVVIVSCNIRVILISNQFNIIQGLFCSFGIITYYITYFLVGVIIESDSKNTLIHEVSTGIYWILIFFFSFMIEGAQVFFMSIENLDKIIAKEEEKRAKVLNEDQVREIEMVGGFGENKEIEVKDDRIAERSEIGGYAFAEDDNRMAVATEMESSQHQKSLSML